MTRGLFCLLLSLHALAFTPSAENVLLISVDTLRADRLSCYGYQENRTEKIDLLAREGYLFEQAYSEYPLPTPPC
ncbi:MAG: sulfatase-like hydrolase/transferase [Acidobacteriota bacterium]|nr:MAG: sulfatase-like hydrolase/transferase [Acidobacteriota bacterium]